VRGDRRPAALLFCMPTAAPGARRCPRGHRRRPLLRPRAVRGHGGCQRRW